MIMRIPNWLALRNARFLAVLAFFYFSLLLAIMFGAGDKFNAVGRGRRRTWSLRTFLLAVFLVGLEFWYLGDTPPKAPTPFSVEALSGDIVRRAVEFQQQACTIRFFSRQIAPYCERFGSPSGSIHAEASPVEIFEVYTPVRAAAEANECTQTLMVHSFAFSFGIPFVGNYTPPACEWTNVFINLTMTVAGVQFDRLAMMYMGDTEVFRTSTAEPIQSGVIFNYEKDMTRYSSLFRSPQILIFDLQNLVNDQFTGIFNATMIATFWSPEPLLAPKPADSIFPISSHMSSQGQRSVFSLPGDRAVSNITLPLNTTRAVVGISSSGDSNEEFWYTNVPNTYTGTFGAGTLLGFGPWREIQVLIDGAVAGVAWPFETVFTGGIVPSLWEPIVSITAYDLPEYEIDISPFIPLLLDGEAHEFEIRVMSYDESTNSISTGIGSDWLTSGRVFVWSDPVETFTTTGTIGMQSLPDPEFAFTPNLSSINGTNSSLAFELTATRTLTYTSSLNTSNGTVSVTWTQALEYAYSTLFTNQGNNQTISTVTSGSDGTNGFGSRKYSFPFDLDYDFIAINANVFNLSADLREGLAIDGTIFYSEGIAVEDHLQTSRHSISLWNSAVGGLGNSTQQWTFDGPLRNVDGVESYERNVSTIGLSVVENIQTVNGVLVPASCINFDEC